ncbi:hypothetical protein NLJ89_g2821 [Agrocybe chaxingu]|uniref:Uncharacterized protein n=1 Tax=Agrocybe chaxingu TaxID=84603 RepID=A0A9W8MYQ8_9AGAR|nr:hypothetical protein NLJ89_g2821 [Agrocybe chaxingu]
MLPAGRFRDSDAGPTGGGSGLGEAGKVRNKVDVDVGCEEPVSARLLVGVELVELFVGDNVLDGAEEEDGGGMGVAVVEAEADLVVAEDVGLGTVGTETEKEGKEKVVERVADWDELDIAPTTSRTTTESTPNGVISSGDIVQIPYSMPRTTSRVNPRS